MDWYTIDNIDELDTPALVVYPDRVKQNIAAAINIVGDVARLRPHVKTHKSPDVTKLMLDAGITKYKCATIAEAEMLCICKCPDVLLAYQPIGPKLKRFIRLIKTYPGTKLSCLIDNMIAATAVSEGAIANNIIIPVYIDLNVGQNRTGIRPNEAFELYKQCKLLHGIKVIGLHAYDGHIYDPDINIRTTESNKAFESAATLKDRIEKDGDAGLNVITGGSPTFPIHAKRHNVECSPGTFVYWDKGYSSFTEQPFLPAALVITRVISQPDANKLCLDLGHKSIAAERELKTRVLLMDAPGLEAVSQSEEHLVVEAGEGHQYKEGDVIYGMPYHVCPTVALYERAITIENGQITGEWKNMARDRKINI
ncbi:D-TA family PLP-dependent enzyme [Mucilaginibacter sp. L3T2-6]|uniref:D-TA family PLP-dependent enzyme n=1 Tax=Mucilaginibacter sp. L3T2-6 TaxID=3062491 RepID=UPI002674945E|nr:D-TA family PLP-dependent enzyme [Mucilaginibacter sp. L3T2-6]MDO3642957.1 D-TA family PLP-dependent enzyme [Mucilaginibacter sp. L3T2-6]MDV6215282.1 D-TA family PLP-dependent enzyme [Mucilaginibacter sp. L3T2-6]